MATSRSSGSSAVRFANGFLLDSPAGSSTNNFEIGVFGSESRSQFHKPSVFSEQNLPAVHSPEPGGSSFDEQNQPQVQTPEPRYAGHRWRSKVSSKIFSSLKSRYRIPETVIFATPRAGEGAVNADGSASHVALFPDMFSSGLRLPFPLPVREVLHHLGLAPSQLHPNAWRILICCCILWRCALLESDPEHADLTYREFLLTHNVKRGIGNICSFRAITALVVLEKRYRKIKNWTNKFFFVYGMDWEFPIEQISSAKFPIRAEWGVVPNDKAKQLEATDDERRRIAIVKKWVENYPHRVHSEALLREGNIAVNHPPIDHTIHARYGIFNQLPVTLSRKRSPSLPVAGKGKKPREKAKANSKQEPSSGPPLCQSSKAVDVQLTESAMQESMPSLWPLRGQAPVGGVTPTTAAIDLPVMCANESVEEAPLRGVESPATVLPTASEVASTAMKFEKGGPCAPGMEKENPLSQGEQAPTTGGPPSSSGTRLVKETVGEVESVGPVRQSPPANTVEGANKLADLIKSDQKTIEEENGELRSTVTPTLHHASREEEDKRRLEAELATVKEQVASHQRSTDKLIAFRPRQDKSLSQHQAEIVELRKENEKLKSRVRLVELENDNLKWRVEMVEQRLNLIPNTHFISSSETLPSPITLPLLDNPSTSCGFPSSAPSTTRTIL